MSPRDQDYNYGQGDVGSFFANPMNILRWSVPLYRSAGLSIRLHFWFILVAVFLAIEVFRSGQPAFYIPMDLAVMLAAVLLHEVGHRVFARWVGGDHSEWVLWPLGGMVPPRSPHDPWSTFVANVGGIAVTLPLGVAGYLALRMIPGIALIAHPGFSPFNPLNLDVIPGKTAQLLVLAHALSIFVSSNAAIFAINLFPSSWFDGGSIWQSILWPKFGIWRASLITWLAGMVLSVPFFFLTLFGTDFLGMAVWFMIFTDCLQRRRMLAANGPESMENEITYDYMGTSEPRRKQVKKRRVNAARKRARAEQAEQARIDAILDKVKEKGLHSLTWGEKRALRKATERQRERDLARRL